MKDTKRYYKQYTIIWNRTYDRIRANRADIERKRSAKAIKINDCKWTHEKYNGDTTKLVKFTERLREFIGIYQDNNPSVNQSHLASNTLPHILSTAIEKRFINWFNAKKAANNWNRSYHLNDVQNFITEEFKVQYNPFMTTKAVNEFKWKSNAHPLDIAKNVNQLLIQKEQHMDVYEEHHPDLAYDMDYVDNRWNDTRKRNFIYRFMRNIPFINQPRNKQEVRRNDLLKKFRDDVETAHKLLIQPATQWTKEL